MTTKVTNIYNLKLTPSQFGQNSIVVNCSQYDSLFRVIQFNLYNGNAVYSIPEGSVVTIRGTKKDNTGFEYECDYSNNVVTFPIQQQITIFPGKVPAELRITSNGEIIGSWNFLFLVEESPLSDETTISETQLPLLEQAIEAADRLNEAFDDITEFTDETYPNAVQTIQNEGATQVANVTNEGTTQRGLVSSEGATQIANVQAEGTTQVGNVQAKGDEVIASIPSDYTELSGEVADLKSAIIRYPKIWNAVTDGGCDTTNTQDCSSIIQSAFDSASDGTVFYFPAGRYKISNALTLTGKNDIKIVGDGDSWNYGSRFFSGNAYTMLSIYGGNRLEISDILFYGNNISTSTAIGFEDNTPTTMDCRVGNTKIHDISIVGFKNGIRVNAPTGYMNFYRVHISRIQASGVGISIGELYHNTGTTDLGYTIIPNNIFIDNCTIDDLTNGAGLAAIRISVGHYIFIRNCDLCNFTGTNGYGIYIVNSAEANSRLSDISILGNSCYNNRVGVAISSVANPSIKRVNITANFIVGRIAEGQSAEYGVRVAINQNTPKIENLTVLGNTFNHTNSGFTNFAYSGAIDTENLYSAGVDI